MRDGLAVHMPRTVAVLTVTLLALLAGGCWRRPHAPYEDEALRRLRAGEGACQPPPIEVFLQAADDINPSDEGQPMPVEVRVFLLRDRLVFDQLDFETLWHNAEDALAKDLVRSAAVTVFPGKLQIYPVKSSREVADVALVALFRAPKENGWRYVVDVSEQTRSCGGKESLHTIVHALLRGSAIVEPDAVVPGATDAPSKSSKHPPRKETKP